MHKIVAGVAGCVVLAWAGFVRATPVVANVNVSQRAGTKLVDVSYDLTDTNGLAQTVWINVSGDGGVTWTIPASSVSGDAGSGIVPGTGKHLVWNAGQDWNGQYVPNCKVRVFANDGTTPIPPAGMSYIPSGQFQMGDNLDGEADAQPVHNVQVDAFFMDINDVSGALWLNVRTWAASNGYTDMSAGAYAGMSHPVQTVTWYDAVKWCNARSEKEGLVPVYYTSATLTNVYRTGGLDLSTNCVKWTANGYRLPTEAEWEKAARGALLGMRYPWGNTIGGNNANYLASGDPFEGNTTKTTPCGYYNGSQTPAGPNMANGYGLYDMAGNAYNWCWDWYDAAAYARPDAGTNPLGPPSSSQRVVRGGAWDLTTGSLRSAYRDYSSPSNLDDKVGLRCVRGR